MPATLHQRASRLRCCRVPCGIMSERDVTSATSAVWSNHVPMAGTPEGFTLRTTFPTNADGVEVMLEQWKAGTEEPPHSHPGDDMTVVVEGSMSIQFFVRDGSKLAPDGDRIVLKKGDTGYVKAGRIHDA